MADFAQDNNLVPEQVLEVCKSVFPGEQFDLTPLRKTNNQVYRIELTEKTFCIKFAKEKLLDSFLHEARVLNFLNQVQLPVPKIIAQSDSEPYWFVIDWGGASLGTMVGWLGDELLIQAGKLLATYHSFELSDDSQPSFPFPKLNAEVRLQRALKRLRRTVKSGEFDLTIADRIFDYLQLGKLSGRRVFSHGEFTLAHILVEHKQVSSAIDWAHAEMLVPARDVAMMEVFCTRTQFDFESFFAGYRQLIPPYDYSTDANRKIAIIQNLVCQLNPKSKNFPQRKLELESWVDYLDV